MVVGDVPMAAGVFFLNSCDFFEKDIYIEDEVLYNSVKTSNKLSDIDFMVNIMTRTISKSMAGILEDLELDNITYVTLEDLTELAKRHDVSTEPSLIASRLKKSGWLLPTSQRGVWEFASASMAGPYSKNDPLMDIKAFKLLNPDIECYVCLQTAAWVLGLADRVPAHKELAFSQIPRKQIPESVNAYKYSPTIPIRDVRGVSCLAPESIIVHIATKPDLVQSWESVMEWLPDVVYEAEIMNLLSEISDRNDSIKRRTGYLLQGMYPDASDAIYNSIPKPTSKIRFGARKQSIRNDEKWKVSDTSLPFSTKEMEKVK